MRWGQYLCEGVTLLSSALGLAGWVAEREDDWALVERGHVSDDLLGEGTGHCSHSWDAKQRRTTQAFCDDYALISNVHIFPTEKDMGGGWQIQICITSTLLFNFKNVQHPIFQCHSSNHIKLENLLRIQSHYQWWPWASAPSRRPPGTSWADAHGRTSPSHGSSCLVPEDKERRTWKNISKTAGVFMREIIFVNPVQLMRRKTRFNSSWVWLVEGRSMESKIEWDDTKEELGRDDGGAWGGRRGGWHVYFGQNRWTTSVLVHLLEGLFS